MPPRTRIEETVLDLAQAAANVEDACAWVTRGLGRRLTTQDSDSATRSRQRPHVHFRAEIASCCRRPGPASTPLLEYRYVKWVEVPHGLPRGKRQAKASGDGRRIYRDVLYDELQLDR